MNIAIICSAVVVVLLIVLLPNVLKAQPQKPEINRYIEYLAPLNYVNDDPLCGPDALYGTGHPEDAEKYRNEVYPLNEDRFIRRIKMTFGVDITGHYDDKGHTYMTPTVAIFPESQLVKIRQARATPQEGFRGLPTVLYIPTLRIEYMEELGEELTDNELLSYYRPLSFEDILSYCKWLYYNDGNAYLQIKQADEEKSNLLAEYDGVPTEIQHIIHRHRYAAPFDCRDSLPRDVILAEFIPKLNPALTSDVNYINALNTIGKDRVFNNIEETEFYKLDFDIVSMLTEGHYGERGPIMTTYRPVKDELHNIERPPVDSLRYGCFTMGILPSLNRYMTVPHYAEMMGESVKDFLHERKDEFEKYDYFGHTLLRNVAKGKKIDNSTIGVPMPARVKHPAEIRIDPYDAGIEFDSLKKGEFFTVYEMGYDDYYLVQCAKPVEEWDKCDENGNAVCTGRMERVWGYVAKKDVEILDRENHPVRPFIDWGMVSSAEGLAELYDREDKEKVIGTIPAGEWVKLLSYDIRSYLVETQDGRQGRIEKTSIIW